jgi:hypothetical protein
LPQIDSDPIRQPNPRPPRSCKLAEIDTIVHGSFLQAPRTNKPKKIA